MFNRVNTPNIVIEELNLKLNTLIEELNNMGEKLNMANRKWRFFESESEI